MNTINRRAVERFALPPMHTSVTVSHVEDGCLHHEQGHAYDVSEHGVRIELDRALPPGEQVEVKLSLPGIVSQVRVNGNIIWLGHQDDDPGPRRMAVCFTSWGSQADRDRLLDFLGGGGMLRAA